MSFLPRPDQRGGDIDRQLVSVGRRLNLESVEDACQGAVAADPDGELHQPALSMGAEERVEDSCINAVESQELTFALHDASFVGFQAFERAESPYSRQRCLGDPCLA